MGFHAETRVDEPRPPLIERLATPAGIALGVAIFGVWTWMTVAEQYVYQHYNRDVSIYVNLLWNLARGHPYETTLLTRNSNHLAEHVVPLLVPLSVVYQVVSEPWLLLVLQQAALAISGIPIFLLARRRLEHGWAAVLVLATYYLAPALTEVAWDYVHAVAFATVPLSFGAYFLLTGRHRLGLIVVSSTLLLEEQGAVALFGLGLLLLLDRKWRSGTVLCATSVAWLTVITLFVMPSIHLRATLPEGGNRTLHNFYDLGRDPSQAMALARERGLDGLRWFLLPNAGLGLLAPQTLVAALPTSFVILFADDPHYLRSNRAAPALPLLWIATVEGLAWLRPGWRRRAALVALGVLSLTAFALDSRLPGGGLYQADSTLWDDNSAAVRQAIEAVPADVSVGATQNAAAFLAERPYVKIFPFKYARVLQPKPRQIEWWVLDLSHADIRTEAVQDRDSPLRADPPYALWLIGDWVVSASDRSPATRLAVGETFGRTFRLDGYDVFSSSRGPTLRLAWTVVRNPSDDFVRQVTIVSPDGKRLGVQEGPAIASFYGTSRWLENQVLVEDLKLPLAMERLGGGHVEIRWMSAAGDQVLEVGDGADRLNLDLGNP